MENPLYPLSIENGVERIYYGISIAFAIRSIDHSLFSRLIPTPLRVLRYSRYTSTV